MNALNSPKAPTGRNYIEQVLNFYLFTPNLVEILKEETFCRSIGRVLSSVVGVEGENIAARLTSIPSETSFGERGLLFNLFSMMWSGRGDVLEIGPFFGGTTRAIALGMLHNKRRQEGTKLLTYDRFEYGTGEYLSSLLQPLVDKGTITQTEVERIKQQTTMPSFLDVFEMIHRDQDYYPLISAQRNPLPDCREELQAGTSFELPSNAEFEAVFVDGCKSWFGTKHFMKRAMAQTKPGAFVIFQDYGWYTCFWIPAFIETFSEYFQFICAADSTYVFVLTQPLSAEVIERRYPDAPEGLGIAGVDSLFKAQLARAVATHDFRGLVFGKMQYAAALAYIGEKSRAKAILADLATQEYAKDYLNLIKDASISPTYRYNGELVTLE